MQLIGLVILIVVLFTGCISLRPDRPSHVVEGRLAAIAPPSPVCVKLSNQTLGWHLAGIITGAIGSGAATGAGIFSTNEIARDVMAGGAAVFSLAGAVAGSFGGFYGAQYTKQCE